MKDFVCKQLEKTVISISEFLHNSERNKKYYLHWGRQEQSIHLCMTKENQRGSLTFWKAACNSESRASIKLSFWFKILTGEMLGFWKGLSNDYSILSPVIFWLKRDEYILL